MGFPEERRGRSGTTLDTSRFRHVLGDILDIAPNSVRGYILGEHGDTQFAVWEQCPAVRVVPEVPCLE